MKYLFVIIDGASDRPLPALDGRTPLEVAKMPVLSWYTQRGEVGRLHTIPEGYPPGSDVGNMGLFGYDPRRYYTGRGPIEAASMELPLNPRDVVFRCNLVTSDGETMLDYSAGEITTEESRELIQLIDSKLGGTRFTFYPGVGYRHLMVWRDGKHEQRTTPPHDILDKPIAPYLPEGDGEEVLRQLMWDSLEILLDHEVNRRRRDQGKRPATMIWLWGQGLAASFPAFSVKYGLTGAVISAVDLVRGIGKLAGLEVVIVPGANGTLNTNYEGKAEAALDALRRHDVVIVHVEAADEAGHHGDPEEKIEALQRIDSRLLSPLRDGLHEAATGKAVQDYRLLVAPDHPTPLELRTHVPDPVPFLIYDSRQEATGPRLPYDERALVETKLVLPEGHLIMDLLLERG
ncbi:MAG TPA: cofactor-independent phosphoglycerate mutase [Armatimonadota bacterium]|jgi:2,3-bisphosphoglycerate-independent phosphoglycerate mutase